MGSSPAGRANTPERPMRILVDLPITFDVGDGRTHAPMIDVLVGGTTTRLILDTDPRTTS